MDQTLFNLINGQAGRSETLDFAIIQLNLNNLFKGVPPMMLFWLLWFSPNGAVSRYREKLVATLTITVVAILLGRVTQNYLPFKDRPIYTPDLDYNLPLAVGGTPKPDWSSFPSDHAVLFFAIATCFWFVNKYAGMAAYLHAIAIATVPRVFLGYHWPSDILGGLVLGAVLAVLLMRPLTRAFVMVSETKVFDRYEYLLYPLLFLLTFQTATMFESARSFAFLASKLFSN